ncbi:cupin fold metalloprotein, WbuC family [bacterium]|nr:cupin fold metalloprotein, WbuC family [bacterium]
MMQTKEISKEVFYADEPLVNVGGQDIEFLKARVGNTERKRIRLCAHKDVEDNLHEMFIVLSEETYIRPHKHLSKAESLHIVEGDADAVFFDERGSITHVITLGDYSSGRRFYYRVDVPVYHTLLIRSDPFIFHETTQGPFRRSDTAFPLWAPEESDVVAAREYMERLAKVVSDILLTQTTVPEGGGGR